MRYNVQEKFCLAPLDHIYPPLLPGMESVGAISLAINSCTWATVWAKLVA